MSQVVKYIAGLLGAVIVSAYYHETVRVPQSPSNFEVACQKLNLSGDKPLALLEIFNIAGYLTPEAFWKAVYNSKAFASPEEAFQKYAQILKEAGAGKDPKDFNAELASHNLFGKSMPHFWEWFNHNDTDIEAAKIILYIAQTAFDRKQGQERNELNSHSWMEAHKDQYMRAAKTLGLIDPIKPDLTENYELGMVFGASRIGLYARLVELQYYMKQGLKVEQVVVLAGERPLWAQIDGIEPHMLQKLEEAKLGAKSMDEVEVLLPSNANDDRMAEGKNYILYLARKLGFKLNPENPFIMKDGKLYPNYIDQNQPKLTETAMSLDLLEAFGILTEVVDTKSQGERRPDTLSTSKDQANRFIDAILSGQYGDKREFHIIAISNNPFIERQSTAAQGVFDSILREKGLGDQYKIYVHGVGFGCRTELPFVHSELGALVSELFKLGYPETDTKDLLFQTRSKDTDVPPVPLIGEEGDA